MLGRLDRQARSWLFVWALGVLSVCTSVQAAELLWFYDQQPRPQAWQAIEIMQHADQDGLRPADYHPELLQQTLTAVQKAQQPVTALMLEQADQQMTAAMQRYLKDLAVGRVSAKTVHQGLANTSVRAFDASAALHTVLQQPDFVAAVAKVAPTFPLYPLLKKWLVKYRALEGNPAWTSDLLLPAGNKLEPGQIYPQMADLRERLSLLGDLAIADVLPDAGNVYDPATVAAIKQFQLRHGLTDDGVIGAQTIQALNVTPAARVRQIVLSMERIRWTPLQHGQRILVVNIPGYILYGYEVGADGKIDIQTEMRVVIGKALNHRTPLMDEMMQYIEFSPYWNIPPSIARNETIPALRRDSDYLNRQQLEFVDASGQVSRDVTPEHLEAVLKGKMRIRQRPGPHNALGGVKFAFPNNQNIFMHHTPATQLFSRSRRDFSHGCIRVEDPVALARFVLTGNDGWTDARIEAAMSSGKANFTRLREPVPVVIAYSTVMARDDEKIYFYPDVYGNDRLLEQALSKH